MPLKRSVGNMYPWVTHTHCHLGGECQHHCVYCYVDSPRWGRPKRYQGEIRLIDGEFNVDYGTGRTIFLEHMNDIFGPDVRDDMVHSIITHARKYPGNTYVFQSKNPRRFLNPDFLWPDGSIFGTTIESNRGYDTVSDAPDPSERFNAIRDLKGRKFITIEPVLDFDVEVLAAWIGAVKPEFLNLGADSKAHDLPEPTVEKIEALVVELEKYGVELREKHNLARLRARQK